MAQASINPSVASNKYYNVSTTNTYDVSTENKGTVVFKKYTHYLFLLFSPTHMVYRIIHAVVGLFVIPATRKVTARKIQKRDGILQEDLKKFTVEKVQIIFNETIVEAAIIENPNPRGNRWILYASGNEGYIQKTLAKNKNDEIHRFLNGLGAHCLVFNYLAVGTKKLPSREKTIQSYRAALHFLEKEKKAEKLILYGHSIGGGITSEGILGHPFMEDKKYVVVIRHSFSSVCDAAYHGWSKSEAFFVNLFGWDIGSVEAARYLQMMNISQIIVQHVEENPESDQEEVAEFEEVDPQEDGVGLMIKNKDEVAGDRVIDKEAALAYVLLNNGIINDKYFIASPGIKNWKYDNDHGGALRDDVADRVIQQIEECLA